MIERLTVRGFRGIRQGELTGLRRLTVLTGPNGCGKSALLDALLLVGSSDTVAALRTVLERHPLVRDPAAWLFHQGEERVAVAHLEQPNNWFRFGWEEPTGLRVDVGMQGSVWLQPPDRVLRDERASDRPIGAPTVLVDPGIPVDLVDAWSDVAKGGQKAKDRIVSALRGFAPDATGLELAREAESTVLRVTYPTRSVPLALAGDGVQAAVQLAILLAKLPRGLALLEEPEVYQHPRTLVKTAKVIAETVARGVQVVCTTHSIELIDALLGANADPNQMAVVNLRLDDGVLTSSVVADEALLAARRDGFLDLR